MTSPTFASHTPWWRRDGAVFVALLLTLAGVYLVFIGLYHVAWVHDQLGPLLLAALFATFTLAQVAFTRAVRS